MDVGWPVGLLEAQLLLGAAQLCEAGDSLYQCDTKCTLLCS